MEEKKEKHSGDGRDELETRKNGKERKECLERKNDEVKVKKERK